MSAWVAWPSVAVFVVLLFFSFRRVAPPAEFRAVARAISRLGIRLDRRVATGVLATVAALWLVSACFVVVPPGHRALVRRFGAPVGDVRSEGIHFRVPLVDRADVFSADAIRRIELGFRSGLAAPAVGAAAALGRDTSPPDTTAAPPSVDARVLEEEGTYLTGDENLLSTKSVVQYRVTDPARWVYGFLDPEAILKVVSLAEAVDVLASYGIDHVYAGERGDVERKILEGIRRRTEAMRLGVEVLHFCLTDVHAPAEVHAAFRDVASAHEDKQTAVNVAWRYHDETVNLARGEAAREVEIAKREDSGAVVREYGFSMWFEV
jgi:membrane protease subunit HflK